jgi:ketosteroid isomerase-like protein
MNEPKPVESQIRELVDRETEAWNALDAEALLDLFHPDTVWPWPPDPTSHDPATWVMPFGRFDRARWKASWSSHFANFELVHNRRATVRVQVSDEEDGAFAVVDVSTLWRHRGTGVLQHWNGRACKVYTKVRGRWYFIHQTGLLQYDGGA